MAGDADADADAAVAAIHDGDVAALERLLRERPDLATARVRGGRTLLHVATDWPGHFPNAAATVAALAAAGADVDAPFIGAHAETPLHWAASSNDVEVLDALIAAGADIEARGAVIAGGTPLSDAVAFGQWDAARRLVGAGARPTFREAAALGLSERVRERCDAEPPPARDELSEVLWYAAHGGQQEVAEDLVRRGADVHWVAPWDGLTPAEAARRSDATELAQWLQARGELPPIVRHQLLRAELDGAQAVDRVEVARIELRPAQETGRHRHPCPVAGYVISGTIRFQVAGEAEAILSAGDAFFEPPDAEIAHFDNASDREPATFVACYLLPPGEERLIEMLDP